MNRIGFLGGSDMYRIMVDDWQSLWEEKTERTPSPDLSENIAVQLGSHTESFNLEWFAKQHQTQLTSMQATYSKSIDDLLLKGQVDALAYAETAIVEAKHTNGMTNMEQTLYRYMPQVQFYMFLSEINRCYLSVIFGNSKWESVCVEYDPEFVKNMIAKAKEFWFHVKEDIPPMQDLTHQSYNIDKISVDKMVKRDASGDNYFNDLAHQYIEGITSSHNFENIKKQLKELVADNEREVYSPVLTIKRDKRGSLRININQE